LETLLWTGNDEGLPKTMHAGMLHIWMPLLVPTAAAVLAGLGGGVCMSPLMPFSS
jgi:hypothetical protein